MDLLSRLLAEKEELRKKLDENEAGIAELSGQSVGTGMVVPASEACKKIPPDSWLVDGLFHSVGFGVVTAPPFCGKSFISAHIAGSLCSGRHLFGPFKANIAVPVLYLYYESGRSEFLRTIKKTLESRGIDGKTLFVNAADVPNERMRIGSAGFEAAIRASGAKFIIADTLAFAANVKEESNEEFQSKVVGPTVDLTKRLGVSILYVHHPQKNTEGVDDVYAIRGGGTLAAGADTIIKLERVKGDARESPKRVFKIVKVRGAHSGHIDLEFDFPRRIAYCDGDDAKKVLWTPQRYAAAKAQEPWPGEG